MRGATHCAQRLKALLSSLRSKLGKIGLPAASEPITQLVLGILSRDVPESKAREALDRIRSVVVDYNELRVIPPIELAAMLGDYPDVRLKCEDISRALNRIFALNHTVGLEQLTRLPAREVRAYLERIDGLEAYTRARVRLLGLRQHAIPLDEAMWAYARREQIVDPRCPLDEAQSFLERQVPEANALECVALLRRQAWNDLAAAVRRREVARILSVPPDRTARNMLQLVGAIAENEPLELEPFASEDAPDEPPAEAPPGARPKRAAAPAGRKGTTARPASPSRGRGAAKKVVAASRLGRTKAPRAAPAARRASAPALGAGRKARSKRARHADSGKGKATARSA